MVTPIEKLSRKLDEQYADLHKLDTYYAGRQPLAFLSPSAKEALGNRLHALACNFPRLVVDSLSERLRIEGIRSDAGDEVWAAWRASGMEDGSCQLHTEALALRRAFVIVWADADGRPVVTVESPRQVIVQRDPATRQVTVALKRWIADSKAHAVMFEPDKVTRYTSLGDVPDGGAIPPTGWKVTESFSNPFGVVPVVPFINTGRLLDFDGVSEMRDVMDLTDALNKLLADAMVSSEFHARARRWVTGLEIIEEDVIDPVTGLPTGEKIPVNPFDNEAGKLWQAENPDTKFGQFDPARLDGYSDLIATLTQMIGAISALPPTYLGLWGDQPASADAIRSAEASLVTRALARQRTFGQAWSMVARLMASVITNKAVRDLTADVIWASAETRTPAQAADAAMKLVSAGIIPVEQALDDLGYTPDQIVAMRGMRRTAALDVAAVDIARLTP